jgi:CHASE3 domain sensor protein
VNFTSDATRRVVRRTTAIFSPGLKAGVALAGRGLARARSFLAPVDPRWLVALSILLLLLGAAIVGKLAQRSQGQLIASSEQVTHVMEIENRSGTLVADVVEAEKAVRTFVVSGRREDAARYGAALDVLPEQLRHLRELTRASPAQQANLDQLDTLANECLDFLGRTIAVHDAGDRESAIALLLAGHVPRLMDALRSSAALIVLEEQRALAVRQQKLAGDAAAGRASLVFVIAVTALFVVTLLVVAFQLSKLRRLARMCAWSRTIEYQGEWLSFEEYLSRRYNTDITHGISPAEAAKMRAGLPTG